MKRAAPLAGIVALAMLAAPAARSATSLTMEQVAPGSPDVLLRWASDTRGPFTLLRREIPAGESIGASLPLHPVADAYRTGLWGPSVLLPGEADLPLPPDVDLRVRVYQLVDSVGGCSNAGYVLARVLAPTAESTPVTLLLGLPPRGSVRDARSLLDHFPGVDLVSLRRPETCASIHLERLGNGQLSGTNFELPADHGVFLRVASAQVLVLVGAASSRSDPVAVWAAGLTTCWPMREDIALPWGTRFETPDEVLCGKEGVDWIGRDFYGVPEPCTNGLLGPPPGSSVNLIAPRRLSQPELLYFTAHIGGTEFAGHRFDLLPSMPLHLYFEWTGDSHDRQFDPWDAGADGACRCLDGDGDGDDDCTEVLFGSDPTDPTSFGPDRDADGVRDNVDDCPADFDPGQRDGDADGVGDACDPCPMDARDACADADSDGIVTGEDNCPDVANPDQADQDLDHVGDACDLCPGNPTFQLDTDGDGLGDACDSCDLVPRSTDADNDCVSDAADNCPTISNRNQRDSDGDGRGDACDCGMAPEVTDLRVSFPAPGLPFVRRLTWSDHRSGSLRFARFEVASGRLEDSWRDQGLSGAECLAAGLDVAEYVDSFTSGSRWYVVGMRSWCAAPDWGHSSMPGGQDARDVLDSSPPCP